MGEEDQVVLTLSVPQARATSAALDLFTRLSIGQLNMIAKLIQFGDIPAVDDQGLHGATRKAQVPDAEGMRQIRAALVTIAKTMGYSGVHGFGISSWLTPEAARRTHDIDAVLRKALAEYQDPNPWIRNVDYDGLVFKLAASDPNPQAEVVQSPCKAPKT